MKSGVVSAQFMRMGHATSERISYFTHSHKQAITWMMFFLLVYVTCTSYDGHGVSNGRSNYMRGPGGTFEINKTSSKVYTNAGDSSADRMGFAVQANQLTACADADHAGAKDRRSVSGYALMLNGAMVMWTSK